MRLPFVCLVFYIPTAQRICAISSYTDKNSRRSSAKLSACCFACFARKRINEHSFRAFLYTVFAHSKTELESQGDDRSLERHCGQGNRPMSFREVKRRGNPLNRNKNRLTIATTALALAPTTAQRICAISSSKDKNSCHSCAKLSAW